jgi:hypothetical protein
MFAVLPVAAYGVIGRRNSMRAQNPRRDQGSET